MQPPFQLHECCWALGKVGREVSHSQSFAFQSSGTCSHLLFLLGCSLMISCLPSWDPAMQGRKWAALHIPEGSAQLQDTWELGANSACWSSQCLGTPEAKELNPGAWQFPKYHFPSHQPTALLHLHQALQGRQLQKAGTGDSFLR